MPQQTVQSKLSLYTTSLHRQHQIWMLEVARRESLQNAVMMMFCARTICLIPGGHLVRSARIPQWGGVKTSPCISKPILASIRFPSPYRLPPTDSIPKPGFPLHLIPKRLARPSPDCSAGPNRHSACGKSAGAQHRGVGKNGEHRDATRRSDRTRLGLIS